MGESDNELGLISDTLGDIQVANTVAPVLAGCPTVATRNDVNGAHMQDEWSPRPIVGAVGTAANLAARARDIAMHVGPTAVMMDRPRVAGLVSLTPNGQDASGYLLPHEGEQLP